MTPVISLDLVDKKLQKLPHGEDSDAISRSWWFSRPEEDTREFGCSHLLLELCCGFMAGQFKPRILDPEHCLSNDGGHNIVVCMWC
ncbi:DEP domain-containing protein 4 [Marmota flaviventris]|uniref:DEP domain-containing protein 4 n=1 Tax=Marmota flaviventris TaxID=93162 RepID=UPI003A8AFFEC